MKFLRVWLAISSLGSLKPNYSLEFTISCVCCICLYCRALLECYIGSREKIPGSSENAINALRYVQNSAPQYYKQMFSLIVSSL